MCQLNLLKGEKLFIKEYITYFEHRDHFESPCKPSVSVTRNKKKHKVIIKIKKDKAWFPLSKSETIKQKQQKKSKSWKKDGPLFEQAVQEWQKLSDTDKRDYALRKIGEEEAISYFKNKKVF